MFFKNALVCLKSKIVQNVVTQQIRNSSYKTSKFICDLEPESHHLKYEETNDLEDWSYVERVLPPQTVPKPVIKEEYLSGWKPPSNEALKNPYFIQRTKNHMLPVYMHSSYRGSRRLTYIRKVQGDIWLLGEDIKDLLQPGTLKPVRIQINEFVGNICIYGDHVNCVKDFLMKKNF